MNKTNRIKTIGLVMLCLPFCGGWTEAPEQTERYVGGELIATYATETISYISKEVVADITTANTVPTYYAVNDMKNACGAVAGGIIVGFYDKYYGNLIPDWDSYYSTGRYKMQNSANVLPLLEDIYDRMQTNVVAPGVSESEFKSGLQSYVVDQGYDIEYNSLGNGNNFNYSTYINAINNNEVSVLFVQPSNFYSLEAFDNEDKLVSATISGNHVMIAFGYYEVKYTLSNGTRTDKYLRVATGWSVTAKAYYKIGSYVDAVYQVKIK